MEKIRQFLARKDVVFTLQRYGIDALGAMAQGLFCTLLVGTILNTLGQQFGIGFLTRIIVTVGKGEGAVGYTIGGLASAMVGPGIAVAIGFALHCPTLVLFSLIPVGFAANAMGGAGGPLAVYVVAIVAQYFSSKLAAQFGVACRDDLFRHVLTLSREDIDRLFYGKMAGHPDLGAAEYSFSDTAGERGVYTFCMCPGGQVVAAASERGTVVVNGMSCRARDGVNSNAAIAVSVQTSDYEPVDGSLALGAIAFQRRIESAAFRAGGDHYDVPVETVGDFLAGDRPVHMPGRVQPGYRGGEHFRLARMGDVLPDFACRNLARGLRAFDRKRPGYAMPEAILSAAETRTSAPVRILRGEDFCAIGQPGLYPCGEGAGYAGGITSAAVDGIRVAEAICARYAPVH